MSHRWRGVTRDRDNKVHWIWTIFGRKTIASVIYLHVVNNYTLIQHAKQILDDFVVSAVSSQIAPENVQNLTCFFCQRLRSPFFGLSFTSPLAAGVICRTPNAERRTPNAERRTQNAERRTQNAERRTQNAERRTQNVGQRFIMRDICFRVRSLCCKHGGQRAHLYRGQVSPVLCCCPLWSIMLGFHQSCDQN